nr:MAG TPA: hypothetical protein [Caudoviricetes sp.]
MGLLGFEPKVKCIDCILQRPMCVNGCDSVDYVKKGGVPSRNTTLGTLL